MAAVRLTWLIWAISSFAQCYYKPYTLKTYRLTDVCYRNNYKYRSNITVSFSSNYIIPIYQAELPEFGCSWNFFAKWRQKFIMSATVTSGISACDMVDMRAGSPWDDNHGTDICETLLTSAIAAKQFVVHTDYKSSLSKDRSSINHRLVLYAATFYDGTRCRKRDLEQFGSEEGMCCYTIKGKETSIDEGSFLCAKDNRCIDKRHMCDSVFNCADQSDESVLTCWPVWAWVYVGIGSLVVIALVIRLVVWCCSDTKKKKKKKKDTVVKK